MASKRVPYIRGDVLVVPLTQGRNCICDVSDITVVTPWSWYAQRQANAHFYAYAWMGGRPVALHRFLLGACADAHVDHLNGDTLDNRRENLRLCSHAENMRNRKKASHSRWPFKGIYKDLHGGGHKVWRGRIVVNGVCYRSTRFATPEEAYEWYCEKARVLHGEFARLA